ncbi:hypothetical protein B0H67DRAFT_321626 [Lasiosphaeris hirsuta]|uniref:DUF7708 domain-containing protein n=1 Tax=Lasiosphaeris hirsuta TaxID=260670 RepID=A0AA40A1V9_9PEZI|nr:hypothetical protein B0H67DRAFT_321626 [Lasiosphaeris hirsuta]
MADIIALPSLRGRDAACWHDAIQRHNSRQKKGSMGKKYISIDTIQGDHHEDVLGQGQHSQGYARALMDAAIDSYKALESRNGPLGTILFQIAHNMGRYARAVDVLVQCDPTIAALVWGSVRILLQIGEEEERASRIASQGVLEIIRHADRWEQVADMPNLMDSARLRKMVVYLYVAVLDFLLSSTEWLRKSRLRRLGKSILGSKADKFEAKLKELQQASDLVDKELQTQSTRRILSSFGEISLDIRIIKDRVDAVLEQGRHVSVQIRLFNCYPSAMNSCP